MAGSREFAAFSRRKNVGVMEKNIARIGRREHSWILDLLIT
jgi:hypothetical protein